MTRAERVAQVEGLRLAGWTQREIASILGISKSTVNAYICDPTGEKDRARKRGYGGNCEVCGAATTGCNGRDKAPTRCADHPDPSLVVQKWPAERIIAALQWWNRKFGEPPATNDWNSWYSRNVLHDEERAERFEKLFSDGLVPWFTTVVSRFGSWNAALDAAGLSQRADHGGDGNQLRQRSRKQTHCKHGHELVDPNLYYNKGRRFCRACLRRRSAEFRARRDAA